MDFQAPIEKQVPSAEEIADELIDAYVGLDPVNGLTPEGAVFALLQPGPGEGPEYERFRRARETFLTAANSAIEGTNG